MTRPDPGPVGAGRFLPTALAEAMADVLRDAAQSVVMPRYRALAPGDVEEKAPGDPVTAADREAERMIASGLAAIRPSARFVGEEACSRDPALLTRLEEGEVWIVDPIDGTANYARGAGPFAMMAAFCRDGEILAACILDPASGMTVTAERGAGALAGGQRIGPGARPERAIAGACRGIVSAFQRPAGMEEAMDVFPARGIAALASQRCAGAEYPLVAAGHVDFALYWRSLAWDHAPGVLVAREAGAKVARPCGAPYRVGGSGPVLVARDPATWDEVAGVVRKAADRALPQADQLRAK